MRTFEYIVYLKKTTSSWKQKESLIGNCPIAISKLEKLPQKNVYDAFNIQNVVEHHETTRQIYILSPYLFNMCTTKNIENVITLTLSSLVDIPCQNSVI